MKRAETRGGGASAGSVVVAVVGGQSPLRRGRFGPAWSRRIDTYKRRSHVSDLKTTKKRAPRRAGRRGGRRFPASRACVCACICMMHESVRWISPARTQVHRGSRFRFESGWVACIHTHRPALVPRSSTGRRHTPPSTLSPRPPPHHHRPLLLLLQPLLPPLLLAPSTTARVSTAAAVAAWHTPPRCLLCHAPLTSTSACCT